MPLVCPNCRQPVEDGRLICPHCGAAAGGGEVWPPPVSAVCPRCRQDIPPDAANCPACGLRLGPARRRGPNGWLIAGTTCGVTALVVGIAVVALIVVIIVVSLGALKACSKI